MKLVKTSVFSAIRLVIFSVLLSVLGISALSFLKVNGSSASADELIGTTDYNYDIVANIDGSGASGNIAKTSDGSLRVFGLKSNTADLEQRFDRIKLTSGYYQIRSRSNNQCMRVLNPVRGGEISMGSCDPNDSTNQFYSGWFENQFGDIRPRNNQNGCFQFTDYANPARLILWDCNGSPYQVLRHYDDRSGLIVQVQGPIVTQILRAQRNVRYSAVLASMRAGTWNPTHPGHTIFAVAKQWEDVVINVYSDGNAKEVSSTPGSFYNTITTPGNQFLQAIAVNDSWDQQLMGYNVNNGGGRRRGGVSFRVKSISLETFLKFSPVQNGGYANNYFTTGCFFYNPLGSIVPGACNCATISTLLFYQATGEKFNVDNWIPTPISMEIDRLNGLSDWSDPFAKSEVY